MTKLSEHFSKHEFTCHHCGEVGDAGISPALLGFLEDLRAHFDAPVSIMSGYRCPEHNRNVGGATHSQHLKGTAADIKVKGTSPGKVFEWVDKNNQDGGASEYSTFVHCDKRGHKARW